MKRYLLFMLANVLLAAACTPIEIPDSGIECGRQFINATYQGNFKRARQLVLPYDEHSDLLRQKFETPFRAFSSNQKENLSHTSIQISNLKTVGDSVQLITYTNAYTQQPLTLRCVNRQGEWLTDLVFTFNQPTP